ncbi:hypothetical protein BDQ17DRAFT_1314368 [Cyathus striatus]|nr:hypothetical protein BDQ17DRAFT_1314368 [Cyathus striatus]
MPAPQILPRGESRPALGHVNLMVDTFIANASVEDLRSITRTLLATGPPGTLPAFIAASRSRLNQTNAKALPNSRRFFHESSDTTFAPTSYLAESLARARSLYGAGMGFASLEILASVVRASVGLRWQDEGELINALAVVDADISQAIQSCKEEIEGGNVINISTAKDRVDVLRAALTESLRDVQEWGGEFQFERASASLQYWKF